MSTTVAEEIAIRTEGLTKRYPEVTAVDGLCLSVRSGEVFGFLGRNGAGKTTTIRMVLGLVRPSAGTVRIFGRDVVSNRKEAVAPVGSLVETATAYPTLTVRENLEIHRRLTHASHDAAERVIRQLGLESLTGRQAGRLSLGNRQRLALARALLPDPRLLVLDEPANALDPAGIVEIRRLLRRLADERGVTVFVSSHILGEVAQLVDRIGIIHRGRLLEVIETGKLSAGAASGVVVRVSEPERAAELLRGVAGVADLRRVGDGLEVAGSIAPAEIARLLVEAGLALHELRPRHEELEARFLRLTGGEQ
ncbi:MAG: ABC transporter ATP-binding protein [Spirochaetes bacterium]|nr:ABC transporter ATP-binding protein [Spirochaetota bacterium]